MGWGCMIWRGMYGSGVRIDMGRIIIMRVPETIQRGLVVVQEGCFAAGPMTGFRGTCGRRTASGATRRTGAAIAASVWAFRLGSHFLISEFVFSVP